MKEELPDWSEATRKTASALRHISNGIKARIMLHPVINDAIHVNITEKADAEIKVHQFDENSIIYVVEMFIEDVNGNDKLAETKHIDNIKDLVNYLKDRIEVLA